ncbi:hypothetical protein O181_096496 [Austropuccinia psidii MF-1]|uniref:Uncharacterized protein n=1 Tax=Austropuccinia psidii MF-1 TaxID=1389203 RepID=A0A9Q3J759_9BASI|nr:hypothetical protein [Austropuccinia psidii MF-1]
MDGEVHSGRGGIKSRRSRSFSGLLGGYPGMSQGARARLGEVEDEEGEDQPLVSQTELSLLKMLEQMTQFMGHLTQAVTPRDKSKAPAFKTPSMKAPDSFDGTQAHKLRKFIQSCQLIFHDDPANFFLDRKKVLY